MLGCAVIAEAHRAADRSTYRHELIESRLQLVELHGHLWPKNLCSRLSGRSKDRAQAFLVCYDLAIDREIQVEARWDD